MVVSNNLHICFIASLDSIHSRRWIKYFSDLGYLISVIDYSDFSVSDDTDLSKNISIYKPLKLTTKSTIFNLLIRVLLVPINNWKISSILKTINPDILHSHYINDWSFIGAWNYQGALIATAWGSDVLSKRPTARITKIFKSYVMKKSSIITCDGNHIRDSIKTFGVDPSKIQLINFGTDTQLFHPKHKKTEHNIRLLNKSSINIISLRNLEPIYDVASLILATPKVLAHHPKTNFIICGSGSEKSKLQQLANSLGTEDNITFTGKIDQDDLPKLLANADIYVSTALSDAGLAASTAESMASETPVIVTEGSDNHLWVDNGNSGFLIPPKKPGVLAEKIIDLIENPETRKVFGKNARTKIVTNNDWNTEMSKMNKIYEDLK